MTTPLDPGSGKTGGLLARLRGMMQALTANQAPSSEEIVPTWDNPASAPTASSPQETPSPPLVNPGPEPEKSALTAMAVPMADSPPVGPIQAMPKINAPSNGLSAHDVPVPSSPVEELQPAKEAAASPVAKPEPPPVRYCAACQAVRGKDSYCDNCGYHFPAEDRSKATCVSSASQNFESRLIGRYEITAKTSERCGVERFRGLDHLSGSETTSTVVLVRMALPNFQERVGENPRETDKGLLGEKGVDSFHEAAAPTGQAEPSANKDVLEDEALSGFETPQSGIPITDSMPPAPGWPSVGWERNLLQVVGHTAFPKIVDSFVENGFEYLVEEIPAGHSLWDAWDDPEATAEQRFGWLKQIAEALHALHMGGAILEALRPDIVIVDQAGKARFTDLADLLPVPLPADAPLRATFYTAPELIHAGHEVDARADLYSFGAMLYALHVGRELGDMDFERPGFPKPFIPRFPDIHPLFGRLVSKTFRREVRSRFPTEEAAKEDPTGFTELIKVLEICRQTFDNVRLEIAAWTTTGVVRSGNEDAFALMHAVESGQDNLQESALILLADGMGGYEAGEVAAALAIHSLRKHLLEQPPFQRLAGHEAAVSESPQPADGLVAEFDIESCQRAILAALKNANKEVYNASRNGVGKRGMGCTAEVVYVNGTHVVVGHVGDSRTYHLHEGRLIQLTRDHTLVGRLVELGTLTPEEAENHPRKNELQQAIGGRSDVEPGVYHGRMKPGDWVVVCSDGLTNHVNNRMLKEMLQSEATSAEMAARRLVNLVNVEGATDNATVVVVRAT
ncbi:MAG: protein kinase domain-containing protein [Gemmataceae bacterium]